VFVSVSELGLSKELLIVGKEMSDTLQHFSPTSSGTNFSNLLYPVWSTNTLNLTPAIVCCSDFQESRNTYF